jgi:hypothetical protein
MSRITWYIQTLLPGLVELAPDLLDLFIYLPIRQPFSASTPPPPPPTYSTVLTLYISMLPLLRFRKRIL